jgi:hypothetical protein
VDSLKHVTPEMQRYLDNLKRWGQEELERPDFVWHILLQSFSTWGGARGHEGLIGNQDNYSRVTFAALSEVDADARPLVLEEVFLAAKVRYAVVKAKLMSRNYDLVAKMGGPVEATKQALAQDGREAKIAFMKRVHGIGPKYARNIWMDAYHPDFRETIAVDLRIRKITKALGYSFKTYEEEERLYQDIAKEADLQGWEVDRLLYEYTDRFLSAIAATEREKQPNRAAGFGQGSGDIELTERLDHEN